jgi:hypothetical protein
MSTRPVTRHNTYESTTFPGLVDLVEDIDTISEDAIAARRKRRKEISKHLSDLMIMVRAAAAYIKPAQVI